MRRAGAWAVGAPSAWLPLASIVRTILDGRDNRMPAHEEVLTPEQIKLLSAWVWGLSNQAPAKAAEAAR